MVVSDHNNSCLGTNVPGHSRVGPIMDGHKRGGTVHLIEEDKKKLDDFEFRNSLEVRALIVMVEGMVMCPMGRRGAIAPSSVRFFEILFPDYYREHVGE